MIKYKRKEGEIMSLEERKAFFIESLKKIRVQVEELADKDLASSLKKAKAPLFVLENQSVSTKEVAIAPKTLYKFKDDFGFSYRCFKLSNEDRCMLIGPFLSHSLTKEQMLELGEKNQVLPKRQRSFEEYVHSLPIIEPESSISVLMDTFLEFEWKTHSFSVIDLSNTFDTPLSISYELFSKSDIDDVLIDMQTMEKRYRFENDLIKAVSLGQEHKQSQFFSSPSLDAFEKRTDDLLRNAKNYDIIMNTLLRKAAEAGGVHPIYIDRLSSEFAFKIEQLPSIYENSKLMREMFVSYCKLVKKNSSNKYSPIVQKAITCIDSDLSANLSGSILAKKLNVSLGYLSSVFKKETGKTVSCFVREKRIKYALKLLSTTNLQIQTIALHCGIMDLQYFTKIFKKSTGQSPKQFRMQAKNP